MKLNKVYALAKKLRTVGIIMHGDVQWVRLYMAMYPLYGYPLINSADEALALLEVPADERDSWDVEISGSFHHVPAHLFAELDPEEDVMLPAPFGLTVGGDAVDVFCGGEMIKDKFLSPVECDRITKVGEWYRVWDGQRLVGLVHEFKPDRDSAELIYPVIGRIAETFGQIAEVYDDDGDGNE